jgi:hypothetical protein
MSAEQIKAAGEWFHSLPPEMQQQFLQETVQRQQPLGQPQMPMAPPPQKLGERGEFALRRMTKDVIQFVRKRGMEPMSPYRQELAEYIMAHAIRLSRDLLRDSLTVETSLSGALRFFAGSRNPHDIEATRLLIPSIMGASATKAFFGAFGNAMTRPIAFIIIRAFNYSAPTILADILQDALGAAKAQKKKSDALSIKASLILETEGLHAALIKVLESIAGHIYAEKIPKDAWEQAVWDAAGRYGRPLNEEEKLFLLEKQQEAMQSR